MSPPPTLPARPPRPRRLTMAPSPAPGTPFSKRRLDFLPPATPPPKRRLDSPATTTPKRRRAGPPAEHPVDRTRNLVRGDDAGGSCRRGTPSKRRIDGSLSTASAPNNKRRRAAAGGVATEHPVQVICRVRTLSADTSASALEVHDGGTAVRVRGDATGRGSCQDFTLDGVSVADEEGLEAFYGRFVRSRVAGVRAGAKCTVLVYGPTGSGKSHTMFGTAAQPGVVHRALRDILEGAGGEGDAAGKSVQVSVLEIYNEEVYDLLAGSGRADGNASTPNPKTKVRLEVMGRKARHATYISGNEAGTISIEVAEVEKRRILKSTHCNARSSRSHCMIILEVPSVGGRLMLVDMAGSENIEAAGQSGREAKSETGSINQGNITLKRVVESIANGDSHVPFRDSKLTMLLQDSFDDERSKILMILCASPDPKDLHKTISTLEYGARAKGIIRTACAPTPWDKMCPKEAQIRLANEELTLLRMKLNVMEAREAEISARIAAKEEEVITKVAEETRLRGEMRSMEERMLMQQQELVAVKQRLQEVDNEKLDMEEESHLAWRVLIKLTMFLQSLGWRWTPHE